jgi:hypothetical protein
LTTSNHPVERLSPPFVKDDAISTLIPFNSGDGDPIPNDQNDLGITPRGKTYGKIGKTAWESISPDNTIAAAKTNRPKTEQEITLFIEELLAWYIFEEIDDFQSSKEGVVMRPGFGMTSISDPGNPPPQMTRYDKTSQLRFISPNRFSRIKFNALVWRARMYKIPTGSKLSFKQTELPLQYSFTISNPQLYRVDFSVEPLMGANTMMPAGYAPLERFSRTTHTYGFGIKCHFWIKRDNIDEILFGQYVKWFDGLVFGLRTDLEFR